jgi:hypothetical protein
LRVNTLRAVFLYWLKVGSSANFPGNSEDFGFGKRLFSRFEVQYLVVAKNGIGDERLDRGVFRGLERRPERLNEGVDFVKIGVCFRHGGK